MRWVLITIIAWSYQFHLMNVSISYLNMQMRIRYLRESYFMYFSNCCVIWHLLQELWLQHAYHKGSKACVFWYLSLLIFGCLNANENNSIIMNYVNNESSIMMTIFKSMCQLITWKYYQWLVWRVWCHTHTPSLDTGLFDDGHMA